MMKRSSPTHRFVIHTIYFFQTLSTTHKGCPSEGICVLLSNPRGCLSNSTEYGEWHGEVCSLIYFSVLTLINSINCCNLFQFNQSSTKKAKVHFRDKCNQIPQTTKEKLLSLQQSNKRASGGKQYWVDGLKAHGVYEDLAGNGLRFRPLELGSGGF